MFTYIARNVGNLIRSRIKPPEMMKVLVETDVIIGRGKGTIFFSSLLDSIPRGSLIKQMEATFAVCSCNLAPMRTSGGTVIIISGELAIEVLWGRPDGILAFTRSLIPLSFMMELPDVVFHRRADASVDAFVVPVWWYSDRGFVFGVQIDLDAIVTIHKEIVVLVPYGACAPL